MSGPVSISHVATMSKPFGVNVEWKWPNGSRWFSKLELQCLREDGRLVKECIYYPNTSHLISGLKSGERVQVRVRIVAANGSTRDWQVSDWIQGESSVDAGDIAQWLEDEIRNSETFKVFRGQSFINEAKIGNGIVSTNYNVKLNVVDKGKLHEAGMALGVEGDQSKVVFKADRFHVHEAAQSIIENAVATNAKTKIRLGDEMKQAVIDAVRESDLFATLRANVDAQTASIVGLQQAVHDAVNDALRNALKPGGAVWARMKHGF